LGEQHDGTPPVIVFYSYAHEDERLRRKLEEHLSLLRQQGMITGWYDRQILPGTDLAHVIDTHLMTAQVILLLISPDFLASDYCYGIEMQRALERHEAGEAVVRLASWVLFEQAAAQLIGDGLSSLVRAPPPTQKSETHPRSNKLLTKAYYKINLSYRVYLY